MKDTLKKLGIRVCDLGTLLFVPDQTIHTWFNRESTIPSKYYGYISGLKIYQARHEYEDLKEIYAQWESSNRSILDAQKTTALRQLTVDLVKNNRALDKLNLKEKQLLQRMHLSMHYPQYLNSSLQQSENLLSWCSLLRRRASFDLGNLRLKIQKLEEKRAILAAQIQYWEGILR